MPTGYTEPIKDGIDFRTYAMRCARAFGACVTMRDESSDIPIPDKFEPSSYHLGKIEEAKADLARAESMTMEEAGVLALDKYQKAVVERDTTIQKNRQLRQRYETMLAEVEAWNPPTHEHVDLKKFMADQILGSIEFDCGWNPSVPTIKSPMEFKIDAINKARHDLAYHTQKHVEEVERAEARTAWGKALRDSLPQ